MTWRLKWWFPLRPARPGESLVVEVARHADEVAGRAARVGEDAARTVARTGRQVRNVHVLVAEVARLLREHRG